MRDYIKKHKKTIMLYLTVLLFVAVFYLVYNCPFKYFFGICCPGCGMTRATLSFFTLDFKQAFYYHPAVFLMPVGIIVFFLRKKIPKNILKTLTALLVIILAIIYFYRLFTGSDIVFIDFESSLIFKIISYIKSIV